MSHIAQVQISDGTGVGLLQPMGFLCLNKRTVGTLIVLHVVLVQNLNAKKLLSILFANLAEGMVGTFWMGIIIEQDTKKLDRGLPL